MMFLKKVVALKKNLYNSKRWIEVMQNNRIGKLEK